MKYVLIIAALMLVLFSAFAHAQTTQHVFKNSLGQNTGRSVTDARGNVMFYDNMGRNTGRASNNGTPTTTFYNSLGQQTGTARRTK